MNNKVIKMLLKVLLTISIILLIGYILSFILDIFRVYNNGISTTLLTNNPNNRIYGREAINIYIKEGAFFNFSLLSMIGILPAILIPIFVFILGKFKYLFSKIKLPYVIIILLICLILNILSNFKFNMFGLIILPYLESFLISFLISNVFYKIDSKNQYK